MKPQSSNLDDYLAADEVVDWKHPDVQKRAQSIITGVPNDIDKTRLLFEWLRDKISHSDDKVLRI